MIGRTNTGGGGGGAGLNFKIVGNPQPSNPAENTIWVDTNVDITGWVFSATEPENPTSGMVWVCTGTSSTVAFNALKKNGITVYPMSAKQYVSGELVSVTAQSYQNGAWAEWWDGTLYDAGNEYEFITGGWKGGNVATSSTNTASIVKNADSITIKNASSASNGAITVNAIDLTNYSTLNVEYSGSNCGLRVSPSFPTSAPTANINGDSSSTRKTLTLDISALEGSYQCALSARSASSVTMYKMWLE